MGLSGQFVFPPTSGKCVLDIKLQDIDNCSQIVKLNLKIYLAHCGFISCPETELGAADGPHGDKCL